MRKKKKTKNNKSLIKAIFSGNTFAGNIVSGIMVALLIDLFTKQLKAANPTHRK